MMPVPMDADSSTTAVASTSTSTSSATQSRPGYTFYLGDSEGLLKSHRIQLGGNDDGGESSSSSSSSGYSAPSLPSLVSVQGLKNTPSDMAAVQKMASGVIDGVGWVIAIARKDATIDVVQPPRSDDNDSDAATAATAPSSSSSSGRLVMTIKNDKMKAGLQRWVGLAVGSSGIYACTSAGDWSFTSVQAEASGESSTQRLSLPEPLQSCAFWPSSDPQWFAYGGEEVPLSVWNIASALGGGGGDDADGSDEFAAPNGEPHDGGENVQGDAATSAPAAALNSKQRKRKRQAEARAKAKEFLPGEVWRAKNLPNDALSLPQRPNITSVVVIAAGDDSTRSIPFQVATGTRDGFVRTYDPSSGVRKHLEEIRVLAHATSAQECSPIKGLYHGGGDGAAELVAADGAGRLTCVDVVQGKSRYQWRGDINGAITSVVGVEAARTGAGGGAKTSAAPPTPSSSSSSSPPPLFLSASYDRLLRLHSMTTSRDVANTKGQHGERGKTLLSTFSGGAAVTAVVWDSVVPVVVDGEEEEQVADESMRSARAGRGGGENSDDDDDEGDDDDDEVWNAMQEVGGGGAEGVGDKASAAAAANATAAAGPPPPSSSRRTTRRAAAIAAAEEQEAAEDEEAVKEDRSKQRKR